MVKWLILYNLFCIVYGLYLLLKKQENGLVKVVIITFLPVIGFAVSYMLFKSQNNNPNEYKSEINEEPLLQPLKGRVNVEREINIIPFQDALLLNDHDIKRSMLMDSLRDDVKNFEVLNKAIKSDDSEISHYAAAAIMEIQRKFITNLQDLADKLKESPLDYEVMARYTETLKEYVDSGIIDQESKIQYQLQLSELLEKLLKSPLRYKNYFVDKIYCDLEIGNYEKVLYYSQLFMEEYPFDEESYLTAIKAFYTMQDTKKLTEIMNTLRKTPIQLSPKGLKTLRFWS